MSEERKINTLILDAGPLITQSSSALQQFGLNFITTPGVFAELKDENSRNQVLIWGNNLKIRQPKAKFIKKVADFAKLTGDYAVLSANDLHIIALTYELEYELNGGDWRLRSYPGEVKESRKKIENETDIQAETLDVKEVEAEHTNKLETTDVEAIEPATEKKKPRRRGGKKQRAKREAQLEEELKEEEKEEEEEEELQEIEVDETKQETTQEIKEESAKETEGIKNETDLDEKFDDSEDDGEWITPENLIEEITKDLNAKNVESGSQITKIKVALASGDFAVQNVSMQIGLNLMNSMSGLQIKRVRNYMYRCHGCFRITPINKDGQPRHFCPYCGGATLLRCAVSISSQTGEIIPHLKKNFEWHKRGDKYSIPPPLSKNQRKLQGNAGFQHNKLNQRNEVIYLREDQKEYQQALKDDDWQRKQNEKLLENWIGGGSADNYISPFSTVQTIRPGGVKVGKSKFVNSGRGKK